MTQQVPQYNQQLVNASILRTAIMRGLSDEDLSEFIFELGLSDYVPATGLSKSRRALYAVSTIASNGLTAKAAVLLAKKRPHLADMLQKITTITTEEEESLQEVQKPQLDAQTLTLNTNEKQWIISQIKRHDIHTPADRLNYLWVNGVDSNRVRIDGSADSFAKSLARHLHQNPLLLHQFLTGVFEENEQLLFRVAQHLTQLIGQGVSDEGQEQERADTG